MLCSAAAKRGFHPLASPCRSGSSTRATGKPSCSLEPPSCRCQSRGLGRGSDDLTPYHPPLTSAPDQPPLVPARPAPQAASIPPSPGLLPVRPDDGAQGETSGIISGTISVGSSHVSSLDASLEASSASTRMAFGDDEGARRLPTEIVPEIMPEIVPEIVPEIAPLRDGITTVATGTAARVVGHIGHNDRPSPGQ